MPFFKNILEAHYVFDNLDDFLSAKALVLIHPDFDQWDVSFHQPQLRIDIEQTRTDWFEP